MNLGDMVMQYSVSTFMALNWYQDQWTPLSRLMCATIEFAVVYIDYYSMYTCMLWNHVYIWAGILHYEGMESFQRMLPTDSAWPPSCCNMCTI